MSLGLSNVAGLYYQNYVNEQSKVAEQSNKADFSSILSAKRAKSMGKTQGMGKTGISNEDAYLDYLKSKFGANVIIQDVGKEQRNIDAIGASTVGHNNVVIAPNILEQMVNNPEKAAYYESKIQAGLDNFPKVQAQLSAAGFEIYSYGVGVEADGTVYTYTSGDLKPEVRAKIEAQIKIEQEEKAKRRQEYAERSQEAADKRRQLMENYQQKQLMAENLKDQIFFTNQTVGMEVSPQVYATAVTAYDKNILGISESGIL